MPDARRFAETPYNLLLVQTRSAVTAALRDHVAGASVACRGIVRPQDQAPLRTNAATEKEAEGVDDEEEIFAHPFAFSFTEEEGDTRAVSESVIEEKNEHCCEEGPHAQPDAGRFRNANPHAEGEEFPLAFSQREEEEIFAHARAERDAERDTGGFAQPRRR